MKAVASLMVLFTLLILQCIFLTSGWLVFLVARSHIHAGISSSLIGKLFIVLSSHTHLLLFHCLAFLA